MRIEHIDCGLAVHDEFDAAAVADFEIALQETLLETSGAFVLDFSGLTFMDSGGVNALLRARALLGREERALALICPPGPPRRVLDVIGVTDLFELFASRDEARAALVPPH
jgi:anti-sigma B factor antagonist